MKLKWLIFVLLFFLPASAFAIDTMNPALSFPPKKKMIGLEYSYAASEMKAAKPTTISITNLESDGLYVKGTYGFFEGNEVFLKVGMANAKIDGAFGNGGNFGDTFNYSVGVGAQQSMKLIGRVRVGAAITYTYNGSYRDRAAYSVGGQPVNEVMDVNNPSELAASMAVSYVDPDFTPFAGVVASWRRFDVKDQRTQGGTTTTTVTQFREDDILGGLVGVEYFRRNFRATVAIQLFKRASAGLSFGVGF